ncbi:MAG: D-TA family PLP-dependent enzyme [Acidobacteriota bacterium]|jgi:D-serine deaminase-like pyridoxal phosphate-dependent protein
MIDLTQSNYTISSTAPYLLAEAAQLMTPALLIYPEIVDSNIAAMIKVLGGDANRWRPHIKTSKLEFVMRRLVDHGIVNFKCATTLELLTACQAGARDILIAYPVVGANARRVAEIIDQHPGIRFAVLVENEAQIDLWKGRSIDLFIDINPGMNRTGIGQENVAGILELARRTVSLGLRLGGLHYYDGHTGGLELAERDAVAHRGYDQLMGIVARLEAEGFPLPEVISAGTPSLPCALSYAGFRNQKFVHRVSPGTIVYSDCTSLAQLPREYGLRPAALVLSTIVSHPHDRIFTCDAGHKAVSADAGVPTGAVVGHTDWRPGKPSEEHLPIEIPAGVALPAIGELIYILPRHVCPTVNNFNEAVLVKDGHLAGLAPVTARGREARTA